MKRTIDRTLQVLVWGVFLTVVWGLIGLTEWAAARSILGAGPGYENALEPAGYLLGAVIVAVSGTRLVQHTHGAWQKGRRDATRVAPAPAVRRAPRIARGRSLADLPAAPPPQPPPRTIDSGGATA